MNQIEIVQFTPIYDPKEDRLRLILNINTPNRYDLMITRRFLIQILDNISHLLESNIQQAPLYDSSSSKESIVYDSLDENLLMSFSITKKDNGFIISFKDNKREYVAFLTKEQLNQLIDSIKKQVQYEWGIFI